MITRNSMPQKVSCPSGALIAGLVLILVGVLAALENIAKIDVPFLPLLAAIFLAVGLLSRRIGLVIPGSILAGVYAGITLADGLTYGANGLIRGGYITLGVAGGFVLITLLSLYTEGPARYHRWPLFVALPSALIAALALYGLPGKQILDVLSYAGPAVLILVGALLIIKKH